MIRHGMFIDRENRKGQTPLIQSLGRAWDLHFFLKQVHPIPTEIQGHKTRLENALRRVHYIAVILIGQLNATVNWQGKAILSLPFACATDDWDLAALLLEHGAKLKPMPTCVDAETFLDTTPSKHRLNALKANAQGVTWPLRLCPCFFGKPVSDCHSKPVPYPDDSPVYRKCCKARNIDFIEEWDEESKSIYFTSTLTIPMSSPPFAPPEVHAFMEQLGKGIDLEHALKMHPVTWRNPEIPYFQTECLKLACQKKLADPAFSCLSVALSVNMSVARNRR
ncbi:hypothetical protein B0H17DRAFT_1131131 [Mycena rosella]|uniref:Uncharacterized protein n=1 Tax=Mycena rosella TaxID=1033263 RepID=A0AAD7GND0_MYCRO|nr:hypothetical protein B0H17DRAFT_1131131 [Mycena rosella]